MNIGIPKGMYIYEYPILFEYFFKNLGCNVIYSDNTNKEIVEEGIRLSVDEACLASKIFLGHVNNLVKRKEKEKIDYIFVPRVCSFKNRKNICVKFFAMYDICKNIFDDKIISLNIDFADGESEFKAFLKLGKKLGFSYPLVIKAYIKARNMQRMYDLKKVRTQYEKIAKNFNNKSNILIVSHPYISHDLYIGKPIISYLEKLGTNIIFADENSYKYGKTASKNSYLNLSKTIYWKPSINLLNGIEEYSKFIDGIIYLTVFPCGPDSLVNEMLLRKINEIPSINLILDEEELGAGVFTRLESFYDILNSKKLKVSNE